LYFEKLERLPSIFILVLQTLPSWLRQQLHCWRAARFARQIELPPEPVVYHGNSQRASIFTANHL
jgi:hypothetical protein